MSFVRKICFVLILLSLLQGCNLLNHKETRSKYREVSLIDKNGNGMEQVSGMTEFGDVLIFVAQKENKLFYVDVNKALLALSLHGDVRALKLKEVVMIGGFPEEASWEAITTASIDGANYLFLSYEHLGEDEGADGNFHKIYKAKINLEEQELKVSKVTEFSKALPVNKSSAIPVEDQSNFGYEAIEWLEEKRQLVLLPELTGLNSVTLNEKGEVAHFSELTHGFRISDVASTSNEECLLVSSFCYKSDPICVKDENNSKLSLAQIRLGTNKFEVDRVEDISNVAIEMETINGNEMDTFNAEGISVIGRDILLVNDNAPSKGVPTMLRKLELPQNLLEQCKI